MTLPALRPVRKIDLIRFDLSAGLPTALHVLRAQLGWTRAIHALTRFMLRSLGRDPLRDLSTHGWPASQETLVRHQLRPVILLDDVLRLDLALPQERVMEILAQVIRMSGARFIEHNVPDIPRSSWRAADPAQRHSFVTRLTTRLFNAQIEDITTAPTTLAFRITACRFVQLTHALGRPQLAPLFCAADSQFFESPSSPRLDRPSTIAAGDACCHFIFSYREDEASA
jgi:hypothetical protein